VSKFGELIEDKVPLLLVFFQEDAEPSDEFHPSLRDVAAAIGDQGKVIKIETTKNTKLTEALRVKAIPTLMIYKGGEMVWRQSGEQNANTLISLMNDYVTD
jgi:thioredoxin 1|tara:strand:+ start:68 stop:370 length:303 start_codon:yes stop_codon:yes gene_type:complete